MRVKLAMSLDGRTALDNGASRWITGEAAREDVQHWRARSSAVLTGVGTVLADDPRLDVRLPEEPPGRARRQPLRVVLDTRLRTPADARLFGNGGEVLILTALATADDARAAELTERGARIESLPAVADRLVLTAVLERLGELEATRCWWRPERHSPGSCCASRWSMSCWCTWRPGSSARRRARWSSCRSCASLPTRPRSRSSTLQQVGEDVRLRLRPRAAAAA